MERKREMGKRGVKLVVEWHFYVCHDLIRNQLENENKHTHTNTDEYAHPTDTWYCHHLHRHVNTVQTVEAPAVAHYP